MNEMRTDSIQIPERKKSKITRPFATTLIGVLIMVVALFLPYMTAVGDMAEYIEEHPDRVEVEALELTASDVANIPIISVGNIITGVYGEGDGQIANIIVTIFGCCLALTALFAIFKKSIAVMIFDLLTGGIFFFLNFLMKEDFISADKYAWGVGYYVILIAAVAIFAGAIWLFVTKVSLKREAKRLAKVNTIE